MAFLLFIVPNNPVSAQVGRMRNCEEAVPCSRHYFARKKAPDRKLNEGQKLFYRITGCHYALTSIPPSFRYF